MEEIWKEHPKINGYEFSNFGRFRNKKTKKNLKTSIYRNDVITQLPYHNEVKRKRTRIARIIAELFVPNENPKINTIVIHNDGNNLNNKAENLRWSTVKETVHIAIKSNKRTSNWEKIPTKNVITIREEYNNSDITLTELAEKYSTTNAHISALVRYKCRASVEPEKKNQYIINSFNYQEVLNFLEKKEKRNKLLKKQKFLSVSTDILNQILYDYVNLTPTIDELAKKFNITTTCVNFNIKTHPWPKPVIQDGEKFIQISENEYISNHGRAILNNRITKQKRFIYNGKSLGIRMLVGILFVKNPNNFPKLKSLDGNIKNIHYKNLAWEQPNKPVFLLSDGELKSLCLWEGKMVPLDDVKDYIIQEHLNATERINFSEKYLIGKQTLYNLLKPYVHKDRKKHCFICGETNERYFYKSRYSKCKLCTIDTQPKKNISVVKQKKYYGVWYVKNSIKSKLADAKSRARRKGFAFNLTEDIIIKQYNKQRGKCIYSNLKIKLNDDDTNEGKLFSIDRVDSTKGYTKDNIVLTTSFINRMKLDYTIDEFFNTIKLIYESEFFQKKFFEKGGTKKF
jgi:hypothetical protein